MANIQSRERNVISYVSIAVITLTGIALVAEMLPEVHAKPIVVAALASALTIMFVDLYWIRRSGTIHGK